MVRRSLLLGLLLGVVGCSAREGTVLRANDVAPDAAHDAATPLADASLLDARTHADGQVQSSLPSDGGNTQDPAPDASVRTGLAGLCRIEGAMSGFYEKFDGTVLSDTWLVAHGPHSFAGSRPRGGFVRDNVSLDNGDLVLTVRGDLYTGAVRGIDDNGAPLPDGKRSAAAVVTRDLFASGTYQMQGRFTAPAGVEVAIWVMADDDSAGGIDTAVPGRANSELDGGVASYAVVRMRSRSSRDALASELNQFALAQPLDDGKAHILRFDWYTVGTPAAQFWVDDSPRWTATSHVPSGSTRRWWLVAWIPDDVPADFESATVRIENAFITPFGNAGDRCSVDEFTNPGLVAPH